MKKQIIFSLALSLVANQNNAMQGGDGKVLGGGALMLSGGTAALIAGMKIAVAVSCPPVALGLAILGTGAAVYGGVAAAEGGAENDRRNNRIPGKLTITRVYSNPSAERFAAYQLCQSGKEPIILGDGGFDFVKELAAEETQIQAQLMPLRQEMGKPVFDGKFVALTNTWCLQDLARAIDKSFGPNSNQYSTAGK